jgi:phosphoglycerol transferase MdoB-like AlkP superfamily enzyme
MVVFDIKQSPPSRQELDAEKLLLAGQKKSLIKSSILSDLIHGMIFLSFYVSGLLSGYALLVAIGLGTLAAVVLASSLKKQLRKTDFALILLSTLIVVAAVCGILFGVMHEVLLPAFCASLTAGSIVIAGAVIGRNFFHVFTGLEKLKYVSVDEFAEQELLTLCNQHPELAQYRQQARDILRPNLTFGELQAMRDWQRL